METKEYYNIIKKLTQTEEVLILYTCYCFIKCVILFY